MLEIGGNVAMKNLFMEVFKHKYEQNKPLFILLVGPKGTGKNEFLYSFAQSYLGQHFLTDFLWIRDLSQVLRKEHVIPIEASSNLKTIPLDDGGVYENRGIREINAWLQQSAFSGNKILLLENIQRMTTPAMNAFLKTCEEPLNNRFLLATVEHENQILPTLVSRALILRFQPLGKEEIYNYLLGGQFSNLSQEERSILEKISLGSIGIIGLLLEKKKEYPELFEKIHTLLHAEELSRTVHFNLLSALNELGILDIIIEVLIKDAAEKGNPNRAEEWITIKKMIESNISIENALWYGVLHVV